MFSNFKLGVVSYSNNLQPTIIILLQFTFSIGLYFKNLVFVNYYTILWWWGSIELDASSFWNWVEFIQSFCFVFVYKSVAEVFFSRWYWQVLNSKLCQKILWFERLKWKLKRKLSRIFKLLFHFELEFRVKDFSWVRFQSFLKLVQIIISTLYSKNFVIDKI